MKREEESQSPRNGSISAKKLKTEMKVTVSEFFLK